MTKTEKKKRLRLAALMTEAGKLTAKGTPTGVDRNRMELFTVGETEAIPEAP
jgi:hypothetical protein